MDSSITMGAFEEPSSESRSGFNDYAGVYLVDEVNNKKHLTVLDEDGTCLCSEYESFDDIATLYGTFPAPPDDVAEMTVSVPGFQPIRDVPISR